VPNVLNWCDGGTGRVGLFVEVDKNKSFNGEDIYYVLIVLSKHFITQTRCQPNKVWLNYPHMMQKFCRIP
jgi:hypothetical protein